MHRFFVPAMSIEGDSITLRGSVVHQLRHVLRLQANDEIIVLDDSGWEYRVRLQEIGNIEVRGSVEQKTLSRSEPRTKITLYQSLLKARNLDLVLQKCTEIGVVEFVPVVAERCVISSVDDVSQLKLRRWQTIILEAAEQSHRGRLPRLNAPMLFPQACERARHADLALLPWEEERATQMKSVLAESANPVPGSERNASAARKPFSVSVFIGPEGGLTRREIDQARQYGIIPVSLGPRILRAETAAIVASALVLYHLDDL